MGSVMIVDDESVIRKGLHNVIKWADFGFDTFYEADNGRTGYETFLQYKPDLVITDIKMPVWDGLKMLEKLKNERYSFRALLLSGYSDFTYAQQAIKMMVDGYLLKPIIKTELMERITFISNQLNFSAYSAAFNVKNAEVDQGIFTGLTMGNWDCVQKFFHQKAVLIKKEVKSEMAYRTLYLCSYITMINRLCQFDHELMQSAWQTNGIISSFHTLKCLEDVENFIIGKYEEIFNILQKQSYGGAVGKMIDYIECNYSSNIKIENLAASLGYNSAYLGKLFKSSTGEYFNTYVDKVRIEKSKRLLECDLKVYEIAEKVGYCDVDYFVAKFKKYCSCTPREYKRQCFAKG